MKVANLQNTIMINILLSLLLLLVILVVQKNNLEAGKEINFLEKCVTSRKLNFRMLKLAII